MQRTRTTGFGSGATAAEPASGLASAASIADVYGRFRNPQKRLSIHLRLARKATRRQFQLCEKRIAELSLQ